MQKETANNTAAAQPPMVGAWHVQVTFSTDHPGVPEHLRGRTENATLLFLPGGVVSATGPIAKASGGEWQQVDERMYSLFLAEFVFEPGEPEGRLSRIVMHASATIRLDEAGTSFVLQKATLRIATYDPTSGDFLSQHEIAYRDDEPNPPERIKGRRLTQSWQVPQSVQPQPSSP